MIYYGIKVGCCRIRVDGVVRVISKKVRDVVETGCGEDVYWSSKVVRAVLEDIGGKLNTTQNCRIVRKNVFLQSLTSRFDGLVTFQKS